jgi:hypothetical protein
VAAGAAASVLLLSGTVANLNTKQIIYSKTEESTVTLDDQLKNIVNDIEATGDHVSQSLETLENNTLTIEKINEINPYFGIDKVHTLQTGYAKFPGERNDTTFFEYYKVENPDYHIVTNLGVFVKANETGDIENMFLMDKIKCITEIGNNQKGSTELLGKLYLTSTTG